MQINSHAPQSVKNELQLMQQVLPLHNARVLELGCGRAEKIRELAEQGQIAGAVAAEVDPAAHAQNLDNPAPGVAFAQFGAQDIQAPDRHFDVVMMLKSLHHVPLTQMRDAFEEIARVLRPGGLLYISEPVFAGDLNEVLRLFHDEEHVRQAAFEATVEAAASPHFNLVAQHFFLNEVRLKSFAQFKAGIIDATHTQHNLGADLLARVEDKFESYRRVQPPHYRFETPNRVDILQRAGA